MAAWRTRQHLEDHYGEHRGELRTRSIEAFDTSAQETIALGTRFTYRDRTTGLRHTGFFHRETSRFTGTDPNGLIVTHFQTDEGYVADLPESTYQDWWSTRTMQVDTAHQGQQAIPESAEEMLTRVRRELVGIHAAMDARTHGDKEIVPWTKRELLTLLNEIRSFQRERTSASKHTVG